MAGILTNLRRRKDGCLEALSSRFARWSKPLGTSLPLSTFTDLGRSKSELIAENALLRQQLIVLKRQVKRPRFTIQKYMRSVRTKPPGGQKWSTFLRTHAANIWACDFLQVTDLFFRPLFAFFNTLAQDTTSDPCRSHTIANGCLGGPTTARSDPVWASSEVSDL